jgi:DNA polymerase-4
VLAATRLHCSIGIGDTTTRAKVATELGKPRGIAKLTRQTWLPVMGERPARDLWGIGSRVAARLAGHGIDTVADLAHADPDLLVAEFGPTMGPHYGRLGRGGGHATVDDSPWVPRAHGRETTYQHDLTSRAEVEAAIRELASQVVEDIGRDGRSCARVHLKVRFAPFFTKQRSRKLPTPTYDAEQIAVTALELLDGLDDNRPIRLLGIRAEMVPPEGGY